MHLILIFSLLDFKSQIVLTEAVIETLIYGKYCDKVGKMCLYGFMILSFVDFQVNVYMINRWLNIGVFDWIHIA